MKQIYVFSSALGTQHTLPKELMDQGEFYKTASKSLISKRKKDVCNGMDLTPKFDVYAFAQAHTARTIDLEGVEAYRVIPEVKAYFEQLSIPKILLEEITELNPDGGDEIYSQLAPRWGGDEGFFLIHSGKDACQLPNLKKVSSLFLTQKAQNEIKNLQIAIEDD